MRTTRHQARRTVLYLTAWNVQAIHEGIVSYAREAGWILNNAMAFSGDIPRDAQPDGVICRHMFRPDLLEFVRQLDVPVVTFEHEESLPLPRVYYDEEAIGEVAAEHLLARGYKTLAFLHLHFAPYQLPRMAGFRRVTEAAGRRFLELAPPTRPATWHPTPGPAWQWLRDVLAMEQEPVGIMATNDQAARPMIDALDAMGFNIPTQIGVIGAENDPLVCEIAAVPFSSVETNTRQIGYQAARLLDDLISGAKPPADALRVAPRDVTTRASTDLPAIPNRHAAEALHYIWQHYHEPLQVSDVATATPVTRRRLQTLFRTHVGRSMQEEIARIRTGKACHLLLNTDLKINQIASVSGFSGGLHLHRTFQSVLGIGPKALRESGALPDLGLLPASAATGTP